MTIDDLRRLVEVLDMNPRAVNEALDQTFRPTLRLVVRDVGHLGRLAALYERDVDHRIAGSVVVSTLTLELDALDIVFTCAPVDPVGPLLDMIMEAS